MTDLYVELLKIGGPVFALASLVVWLAHHRQMKLITMLTNHLTHTEATLQKGNSLAETIVKALDRLNDRFDRFLMGPGPGS